MKTRKPFMSRLATGLARLWAAIKSHPVELLILLHATVSAIVNDASWWQSSVPYAAIATVAAFCISRFRNGMNWALWTYLAILPLYALTALLPEEWYKTTEFIILNFLLPAVYLLTLPTRDGYRFSERFYRLFRSYMVSLAITTILFVLIELINLTLSLLFSCSGSWFMRICLSVCYLFFAPMIIISLESQEEQPKVARLIEVIINYVLTPVLLVYNLILYVYLVTIVVKWDLPKGSVSIMVMAFTIVAVSIRLVRPLLAKQPLRWYFRWFGLFALPLVALFWVAVSYRIGQYGITIDRCILVVVGVLMTLYLTGSIIFNYHFSIFNYGFTALIVLCGVVLAVGGPLSARQASLRSQTAIVREKAAALGILTPEGKLDTTGELFFRTEADSAYRKEHRDVYQAMYYIQYDLSDTTAIRAFLGMTSAEYLDRLSQKTSNYATSYCRAYDPYADEVAEQPTYYLLCYNNEKDIDISGYRHMSLNKSVPSKQRCCPPIPYPGGSIDADTLLATQLAKIGYTLSSNLERDRLDSNDCDLCCYQSPDGNVLIIFSSMEIQRTDSLNHIISASIRCALSR